MATIDWPTTDLAFTPASVSFGARTGKSVFEGLLTGERQEISHLADRLLCTLTLPPCKGWAAAGRRAAFLKALHSTGDWVRMPAYHRRGQVGTLAGTVTAGASAVAGARSISLVGALSRPNLLRNSGFEMDTNADGLSDGLTSYEIASVITTTFARGVVAGSVQQVVTAAGLGSTPGDRSGFSFAPVAVVAGVTYTLAADLAAAVTTNHALLVDFYDASSVLLSGSLYATWAGTGFQVRRWVTGVAPASAVSAIARIYMHNSPIGSGAMDVESVQFEAAAAPTAYAGLATLSAGDFISTGGNLLQVGYSGATANDAGAMTVPLALPLQKAVASGAAVTYGTPTGVWQLDADGISLDYSPAQVMQGIALPFRQVVV